MSWLNSDCEYDASRIKRPDNSNASSAGVAGKRISRSCAGDARWSCLRPPVGNTVEAIANLVQTSPDRVREMIHRFNETGDGELGPQVGGWPSPPDHD